MTEYIERDKVIRLIDVLRQQERDQGNINSANHALNFVRASISGMSATNVRSVAHGKWEDVYDSSKEREVTKCSVCHCATIYFDSPFCQWCGAKMYGIDNE